MSMYEFILDMWLGGYITEAKIEQYILKCYITKEEAEEIMANPQPLTD